MPAKVDAAIAYLADALGHVVYMCWTLAVVKQRYPSLAEAKAAKPGLPSILVRFAGICRPKRDKALRSDP
ncbi:hypothetical protein [Burkholderia pyrrocinia]